MAKTDLIVRLVGQTEGLRKDLNRANSSMSKFKKSVGTIGAVVAGAFAVNAIANFGKEAFKLSQEFQGIEKAFSRLNNSEQLLNNITKATGGAVSQMRLMQMSVQAVNLGIDQNQLAKFFEFATIRAAETGESVDYLVNSIVTGVGRGSIMILDNLGISSQALGAGFASAGDKAERVARVIDDQLGKSALTINDAAKGSDLLSASFTNLQVAVGNFINSDAAQGALSFFSKMLDGATQFLEAVTFTTAKTEKDLRKLLEQTVMAMNTVTDPEGLKVIQKTYERVKRQLLEIAKSKATVVKKTEEYKKVLIPVGEQLKNVGQEAAQLRIIFDGLFGSDFQTESAEGALDRLLSKIQKVKETTQDVSTNVQGATIDLAAALQEFANGVLVSFGEDLGNALTGVGSFGDNIISAVGSFMKRLGEQMIQLGVAKAIMDKLSASLPGGVLIAAGVALVAASTALSNTLNGGIGGSASAGGVSSSGSVSSRSSGNTVGIGQREAQQVEVNVIGMVKGSDLQFVLEKNARNRGITG